MQRELILAVLLLASVTFLFLQILSLKGLDNQVITSSLSKIVGLRNKKDDPSWNHLRTVIQTAESFELQLFIIDPDILQDLTLEQISNTGGNKSHSRWNFGPGFFSGCRHVCGRKRIALGVFAKSWSYNKPLLRANLLEQRIKENCCEEQDPRLLTVDEQQFSSIDFHCAYTLHDIVIDIVLFHEWDNFLWHGTVSERGSEKPKSGFELGKRAGAFNRFKLTKTKVDEIDVWVPKNSIQFLAEMRQSQFINCDITAARKFLKTHGEGMTEEAFQFTKHAKEVLMTAANALDGLGVRYWLSSGTCLGWFRQCGVIPHSKDVDIGIWIKDYDPRLISRFERHGLRLTHKFGKVEDSFELSFKMANEIPVKLDIFFFYEEKDYMWNGGTQAKTGKKFKYIFPKFTLCWTLFLSLRVRVPCETQSYIEANYGTTWNVPVKVWNWKKSPPNVRPNGRWDEKEWPEVIQIT